MSTYSQKYLIGIDEAGRGPLAGPVSVGAVVIRHDFDWSVLHDVTDSKKINEKKRREIYDTTLQLEQEGVLQQAVSLVPAHTIDVKGIVPSIKGAIKECLCTLQGKELDFTKEQTIVLLDGTLKAPDDWMHQKTIIKGDNSEKIIGLASIMAKVTRDQYMYSIAELPQYEKYQFATHKGYGTKKHREAISQYGFSVEHRES